MATGEMETLMGFSRRERARSWEYLMSATEAQLGLGNSGRERWRTIILNLSN